MAIDWISVCYAYYKLVNIFSKLTFKNKSYKNFVDILDMLNEF